MAKTPAQRAAKYGDAADLHAKMVAKADAEHRAGAAVAASHGAAQGPAPSARSNASLFLIAGAVASAFMFWYFHLLVLQQMTQLSNGLAMPDSLVGGFNAGYVESLRHVLNADALGQLQFVHKTAGLMFPLIFAFTSVILIGVNVARKSLRWAMWAAPLLFALAQIAADIAIDDMLGAKVLSHTLVSFASTLVVMSWILLPLSILVAGAAMVLGRIGEVRQNG